ncbi:MAG: TIGR01212 family radical SAM protein [Bacteroidota bacterium]
MSDEKTYVWGHKRRFNAYSNYFKRTFGERLQKLSIDAGFTCPNRDGTVGRGGCTYCNNLAFNPSYCMPEKSVSQQIEEGIEFHKDRYRRTRKYLAYFQAYSNTYAPVEQLRKIYDEALAMEGVVGLVIGTRPDCIDEEKLAYFRELAQSHYITIEYGIESCYDETLRRINRGHDFAAAQKALELTARYGLRTGAHFIFDLPGETREMMLKQADIISQMPLQSVKFHQLQVMKDTLMAKEYREHPETFRFFELEEYLDFFVSFLERLNPAIVVERFVGEAPPRFRVSPDWGNYRNDQLVTMLEQKLKEKDTWQGKKYQPQA